MSQPGELRKQGINACNLFYSTDNRTQEQLMRGHDSPIHEGHAFIQLLRSLGPTRPELKIPATFIKFCRKVYQNGNFWKHTLKMLMGSLQRDTLKHITKRQRTICTNWDFCLHKWLSLYTTFHQCCKKDNTKKWLTNSYYTLMLNWVAR